MRLSAKIRGVFGKWLLVAIALVLCNVANAQPFYRQQLRSERTIVRGGMVVKVDSVAKAQADSILIANLTDSLRRLPSDSLASVSEEVRMILPDSVRKDIFGASVTDSIPTDSLTAKQRKRLERRENRKPLLSDSMAFSKVCWASLVLPGFGQIYNKQYWKLPILYGLVGASLGMCIYENQQYKPLKRQFDNLTDKSMVRTDELNVLQRKMITHNTLQQLFMVTTIASYLYFIGDTAMCYSTTDVSSVKRATTLSTICPGAGQIYNKSYWRFPIVVGGFATTIYCIDWNNRGYERFKKAYRLKADYDLHPEDYPGGSTDEFRGRYSAAFLKNLRNSYRRNRDLCIILTAGLYVLQIIDAHVDAHLRDYDISDDLTLNVQPMIGYTYTPTMSSPAPTVGMSLNFTF